ncbi:MAG TPA: redox-regulated ATPase YchF [Bacillota bacterium]|nr:redox-regulated ATPase YchF [Bacillota bacterium]HPE38750.1 redox-regulated ATPase YchF [Bacillota bacterium]
MKLGIVGLPNVGKSTLFNAITKAGAESANYPFCTIEPNVGVVSVPDARLDRLAEMYNPAKYTPAVIEFVDIAGLVRGASKGEGLGNKFLANIREVDAIVHVVRCFDDSNVVHVDGGANPKRDIETIELELILSDMEYMERRIDKVRKMMKGGDKKFGPELAFYERIQETLEKEEPARSLTFDEEEKEFMKDLALLSLKPVLYVANIAESDIGSADSDYVKTVREIAAKTDAECVVISAKIEEEIAMLDADEKAMFLEELGLSEAGLDKMIQASYKLLGLISFLTAGPTEVRAWTIRQGTKAPGAAGKIHSDFERGFIRAEIVAFDDLMECGTYAAAREKGLVRSEGKEYVMKDGDVTLFRFNV